jgi:MFS family permease
LTAVQAAQPSPFLVLRNRRFLALWLAQVTTQVGANMVLFGLTVQVFGLTGLATSISVLILTFLVPAVIFGAVAGVYVDLLDRRLILVSTNLLRGLLFLAIVIAPDNLILIYVATALVATLTTFFGPAEAAMIPAVVPRDQLLPANSLYIFTLQASFFLGFALLGPLLVNLAGIVAQLVLVAVSYFIGAGLCVFLPSQDPRAVRAADEQGGGIVDEAGRALGEAGSAVHATLAQLADGIRFIIANHTIFWPLTYLAVTASLIGVLGVLGPSFATHVLGLSERDFVVVVLPLGVGLVMGILLLNVYGRLFSRRRGIEGGLVALGITLLALSIAQPLTSTFSLGPVISLLSVVIVVAFAAGVAYAFVAVPAQTQLQEELPEGVRGRVFGVLNMLVSIASFLPIIVVGPIADAVGTPLVVQASAVVVLLVAAGSITRVRTTEGVEASAQVGLVDAADPVALASRSLTQPTPLEFGEHPEPPATAYLSSPVEPGRPGPAPRPEEPEHAEQLELLDRTHNED